MLERGLRFICGSGPRLAAVIVLNALVCALLFMLFEGFDYYESLWWAVTTGTTVGYGDISPATVPGKVVGMYLMVSMVATVAMATAMMAAWLVQDPHLFSHEEQEELLDDVDDVHEMLYRICEHLNLEIPADVAPPEGYGARHIRTDNG